MEWKPQSHYFICSRLLQRLQATSLQSSILACQMLNVIFCYMSSKSNKLHNNLILHILNKVIFYQCAYNNE